MNRMKFGTNMILFFKRGFSKPRAPVLLSSLLLLLFWIPLFSQTIDDPVGDIPAGHPDYMDMKRMKFRQSTDNWGIAKIGIEFWPNDTIPKGSETIFELYMDVDDDSTTGVSLEDIGYDYKLYVNLSEWDGITWIWGKVYWDFNDYGYPQSQDSYYVTAENLISWRFMWEFSLVGLKWSRIDWIARTFYNSQLSDQIPDTGHASLEIDTSVVADVDTVGGEYLEFAYPGCFQNIMDQYEVLEASELGAQIESQLCGTEFHEIQRVEFSPWFQGVAWSGNPIKMGSWMWRSDPPWFIVLHELGHNYTLAAERFNQLYPSLGYVSVGGDHWNFGTNFMEAWATMVGLYAMRELFTNNDHYQLSADCITSLEQAFNNHKNLYLNELQNYEENPDFSVLNPNLFDGIFLALTDSFGYDIIANFFKMLYPSGQTWDILEEIDPNEDYNRAKTISMTITCCAFSVAASADLRDEFRDRWDFPVDDDIYEEIRPEIEEMIRNLGVDEKYVLLDEMQTELLPNYPNPFNAQTVIHYYLNRAATAELTIYDVRGNLVDVLDSGKKRTGYHRVTWDALDVPSGIYVCKLVTNGVIKSKKLMVLK